MKNLKQNLLYVVLLLTAILAFTACGNGGGGGGNSGGAAIECESQEVFDCVDAALLDRDSCWTELATDFDLDDAFLYYLHDDEDDDEYESGEDFFGRFEECWDNADTEIIACTGADEVQANDCADEVEESFDFCLDDLHDVLHDCKDDAQEERWTCIHIGGVELECNLIRNAAFKVCKQAYDDGANTCLDEAGDLAEECLFDVTETPTCDTFDE
jgi:hypothetical protein